MITGANGFIGYHLAKRLIHEGADVYGIIHDSRKRIECLKNRCHIYQADLQDTDLLTKLANEIRPKIVFHLAAMVNVDRSTALISDMMRINFQGTVNLLNALEGVGYECFVNTGTCEEYGDNLTPFKEDQCPRPVSPYSVSKSSATLYCLMLAKTRKKPIVTLRPFLTYGPSQTASMLIPDTIKAALKKDEFKMTKGEQTREFNYVEDIVDAYLDAALRQEARGEIINIGNAVEYTIREVVEKILDLLGNPISPLIGALPYREGETFHFYCDNSKAKRLLGWQSKISLENGLKSTIDWFFKNPSAWEKDIGGSQD